MIREQLRTSISGLLVLPLALIGLIGAFASIIAWAEESGARVVVPLILVMLLSAFCLVGFFMVAPKVRP